MTTRTSKYRAWNIEKEIMCYDNEDGGQGYNWDGWCVSDVYAVNYVLEQAIQERYIFQQFIHATDYSGADIYEGDILSHPDDDMFVIVWCDFSNGFRAKYLNDTDNLLNTSIRPQVNDKGQAVVIGNIFENKELLDA